MEWESCIRTTGCWTGSPNIIPCSGDARWSRLRVGQLLSMNTGPAACVMPQAAFSQDGVRAFFEAPLSHEPGTFFAYNTAASYLAAELVRRAAGRTVPELLARTVFPALGVEEFSWLTWCRRTVPGRHRAQASCVTSRSWPFCI